MHIATCHLHILLFEAVCVVVSMKINAMGWAVKTMWGLSLLWHTHKAHIQSVSLYPYDWVSGWVAVHFSPSFCHLWNPCKSEIWLVRCPHHCQWLPIVGCINVWFLIPPLGCKHRAIYLHIVAFIILYYWQDCCCAYTRIVVGWFWSSSLVSSLLSLIVVLLCPLIIKLFWVCNSAFVLEREHPILAYQQWYTHCLPFLVGFCHVLPVIVSTHFQ
jgi:hypothetical protein